MVDKCKLYTVYAGIGMQHACNQVQARFDVQSSRRGRFYRCQEHCGWCRVIVNRFCPLQVCSERITYMFQWWSTADNKTLLTEYHRRGVYLYRKNRQSICEFAEGLMEDSQTTVDFTVQVSAFLHMKQSSSAILPASLQGDCLSDA